MNFKIVSNYKNQPCPISKEKSKSFTITNLYLNNNKNLN